MVEEKMKEAAETAGSKAEERVRTNVRRFLMASYVLAFTSLLDVFAFFGLPVPEWLGVVGMLAPLAWCYLALVIFWQFRRRGLPVLWGAPFVAVPVVLLTVLMRACAKAGECI